MLKTSGQIQFLSVFLEALLHPVTKPIFFIIWHMEVGKEMKEKETRKLRYTCRIFLQTRKEKLGETVGQLIVGQYK